MDDDIKLSFDCPTCEYGLCELVNEDELVNYKGKEENINMYFYRCNYCLEKYTTTSTDTIWTERLFNNKKD